MKGILDIIQKKINLVQLTILFVMFYFIGIKKDYKYDEVLIFLFSISIFTEKDFINKINNIKEKKELRNLFVLISLNIILFIYNYYKIYKQSGYIVDDRLHWISSIVIKTFYLFLLLLIVKIKKKERTLIFLSIATIIPIVKILNYGIKTGFKNRIMGFWAHPNYVGFYLGIALLLALLIGFNSKKSFNRFVFLLISLISFLEIIFITKSRNAILAVIVSLILLGLLKVKENKKIVIFISGVISLMGLLLLKSNSRFLSVFNIELLKKDGRVAIYLKAFEIIKEGENLFFGKGFSYFYNVKFVKEYGIRAFHNEWLELIINQGLIGTIAYASLYGYILYLLVQKLKMNKNNWIILLGILLWTYLLILGMFDNTIGGGRVFEIVFIVFALGLNDGKDDENASSC